ncbi:hypothetical protein PINS_up002880 [Pythium insidiosum]|nr:hypothetical protein PINS_up002880 [Pythium insidiosum]
MAPPDPPTPPTAHDARVVLQLLEEIHQLVASAGVVPSAPRLRAAAKLYLDTRDAFEATELTVESHVHQDRPKFLRKLSTRRGILSTTPRDATDATEAPQQQPNSISQEALDGTASTSSLSPQLDLEQSLSPRQPTALDDTSEALLDRIQDMFRQLGETLGRAILDELRQRHLSLQNVLHYVRFLPPAAQWTAYLEKRQEEVQTAFKLPSASVGSPRTSVLMTTRLTDLVGGSDAPLRQLRLNAEFVKVQIRRDVDTVCLFSPDGTMATIFGDDINSDLDSVADRFDLLVTEVYAPFLGAIISAKMEQLVRLSDQWQHDMAALMASPLTADAPLTQIYVRPRKFRSKMSVFPRRLTSVVDERNVLLSSSGAASLGATGGASSSSVATPNVRVLVADADHVGLWWQKTIFSATDRDILTTHTDDTRHIKGASESLDGQLFVPLINESSHDFYRRHVKPHGGLAKWRGHRVLVNNGKDSLWVEATITDVEEQRKCKLQLKRSLESVAEAAAWRDVLRNGEWINLRDLRVTLVPVNPNFRVHMGVKLRTMLDVIQTLVLEISSIFPNETLERRVTTALWQSLEPHVARGEHIYARYLRSALNQDTAISATTNNTPLGRRHGSVERSPSLVLGATSMRNLVAALEHSTSTINNTSTHNLTAPVLTNRPSAKMSVRSVGRRAESAVQIQVMPTVGRRSSMTISLAARQLARFGANMPYFDEKGAYHHQSVAIDLAPNPNGSGTSSSAAAPMTAAVAGGVAVGGSSSGDGGALVLSTFEKLAHHLLEESEMIGPCMQANILAISRAFAQVLQERLTKLVRTLQSRLDQDDTSGLDLTLVEYAQASRLAYVWRLTRHELDAVARQRRVRPPNGGTNLHAEWVDRTFDRMEDMIAAMLQLQAQYLHRALFHECTAYILPSVYEQDWRANKPWFSNSRCTYGVQFLIFRIESLLDGVVLGVLEHFERALGVHERLYELSGWLVVDAVACIAAAYEQMVTSRARATQWKMDVLYLVAGLHRILKVLDKMLAPKSPPPDFTQRGTKRRTSPSPSEDELLV